MRRRQVVLRSACMCVLLAVQQRCAAVQTLTELQSFSLNGNVSEALYSSQYNTLFVRDSKSVRAINATTGVEMSLRAPSSTGSFTDFMFTPSGRYLYAADYGGTNIGYGTPSYPSFIHRYDLQTQTWTSAQVPGIAYRIEPVADDRVLLLEVDQWVDMTLNTYTPGTSTQVTAISPGYSGDIEYDAATGRIFYNETGISSTDIRSFTLSGNTITAGQTVAGGSYSSTRAVLSSDGTALYYGRNELNAADITKSIATFAENISAATPTMAFGSTHYYDPATGAELGSSGTRLPAGP